MSPCAPEPRFGIDPRLLENDSVSSVRFNSRTLSELIGGVKGVGVLVLSGRKIVLKPRPAQFPLKAASGPRLGASLGGSSGSRSRCSSAEGWRTSWILKFGWVESALDKTVSS